MLEHLNFPFFYTWGFLLAIFKAKFQHGNSNFKLMKTAFERHITKWEIPLWRQNFGKTSSFDARQAARRSTQTSCISSLLLWDFAGLQSLWRCCVDSSRTAWTRGARQLAQRRSVLFDVHRDTNAWWRAVIFMTSASIFSIEPNGAFSDVSPKADRASPNLKRAWRICVKQGLYRKRTHASEPVWVRLTRQLARSLIQIIDSMAHAPSQNWAGVSSWWQQYHWTYQRSQGQHPPGKWCGVLTCDMWCVSRVTQFVRHYTLKKHCNEEPEMRWLENKQYLFADFGRFYKFYSICKDSPPQSLLRAIFVWFQE